MKISLGMIVRNEGKTLEKCLQSVRPFVDDIVIGLAGKSDDDTADIAEKYADVIFSIPWRDNFAEARNAVLQVQLARNPDYIMWLDGDDELVNGHQIRRIVEMNPGVGAFHMLYDYSRDDNGKPNCILVRERIIRVDLLWRWEGRIHEYLRAELPHRTLFVDDVAVVHHGEHKTRGFRNLELLYRDLEESEPEPSQRLLHYLATEEMMKGSPDKAILHFQRYLARATWSHESYQAAHRMADIYRQTNQMDKAVGMEMAAIRIQPDWPDAYFGLAEIAFQRGEWLSCVEWSATGFLRQPPQTSMILNPRDYDYNPLLVAGLAFANLGRFDEAIGNLKQAYGVSPSDGLRQQIQSLQQNQATLKVLDNFLGIVENLARNDEWLKVRDLFKVAPKGIEQHPRVRELWGKVRQMTAHVEHPELMVDHYVNNPSWKPMPDEYIHSETWRNFPRLAYARSVARDTKASTIIDLGCSDGFMAIPLAEEGYKVDGIDLDPRCIAIANQRAHEWGVDFAKFYQGDISSTVLEWAKCENWMPYDLAILFETIEHVVDPGALLDSVGKAANHIAITTPYLAWERGQIEDWEKVELKGHLRIFDQTDIEQLLSPRGLIHNLYREPFGDSAWIFADYEVGTKATGPRVTLLCPPALEKWGPKKLKAEGLGGSETAVIRLAEEMAKLGARVTVYSDIDEPGYYNMVRYRDIEHYRPEVTTDLFISWRFPEAIDQKPNAKVKVLWMHDTDAGDRLTEGRFWEFSSVVVQTEWHREHMTKTYPWINSERLVILGNGVDFSKFDPEIERNPLRVVYASSPDRGLDVILEGIWPLVVEAVPNAELHYYYGWNNIDASSQRFPHLAAFKRKVGELSLATKNVVNHGRLPQNELAQELLRSSIWLYPTYFAETYCITAIEAQLAGLVPVTNGLAALSETVIAPKIEGDVRDPDIQRIYANRVIELLKNPPTQEDRARIRSEAPAVSWAERAASWLQIFTGVKNAVTTRD